MSSEVIQKILSRQTQNCVHEIELQLNSRALKHLDSHGSTFCTTITAAPIPVNLTDYESGERLQPELNLVLDKLSKDTDTILEYLSPVAKHDPLAKGLLGIYKDLPKSHKDKIILLLNRHDFMYATQDPTSEEAYLNGQFKLVEFNLIACGLGHLSEGVYHYHRSLLNKFNVDTSHFNYKINNIKGYSEGLRTGYELYNTRYKCGRKCIVAMVDDKGPQFQYYDQQALLNCLETSGVPTVRYTAGYLNIPSFQALLNCLETSGVPTVRYTSGTLQGTWWITAAYRMAATLWMIGR
ncbi:uncharacterized protein LOC134825695 [Bolinopsis microptera]|uniref:uncharacterized protein LOC134825695 n=1 Tax=Bolinopsis microptera TaxID=2820187 RepID=UPI00307AB19B